jgi:hypothetical protein
MHVCTVVSAPPTTRTDEVDDEASEHCTHRRRDRADRGRTRGAGVNVPLFVAGCLAIVGAAIHGVGGEVLVVRRLSPGMLPSSAFGGPATTRMMIHVTWHLTTIAFLTVGSALLLSGSVLHGETARAIGLFAAGASTGFALLTVGLAAAYAQSPRSVFLHPGPTVLTATAALAWWGAL